MQDNLSYTGNLTGLSEAEVRDLIPLFGKNLYKDGTSGGFLKTVWNIVREPMFIMLVIACSIYFILDETAEGVMMGVAIFFVSGISFYQEVKSTKALQALKQYTEPRITVIRDGRAQIIFSEDLLPGDIMKLEEGKRIPADGEVLQANDMTVNEAILTGESIPVDKNSAPKSKELFQGTTINSGMCYARVTATGNHTRLGKLGKSLENISNAKTQLQDQIGRFVRIMAFFGFSAFIIIWFTNYLHSGDIIQSLLLGLTLAMSAIPEEIPVAFSSFMALGSSQMAKLGIITRQPQTIEKLGAVSVVCLDKTGTITENKMQVRKLYDFESGYLEDLNIPGVLKNKSLLLHARLASEKDPFDTMEKAIVETYRHHIDPELEAQWNILHEYPLEGQPPMMTHVYRTDKGFLVTAKGAPERIFKCCSLVARDLLLLEEIVSQMASTGYRVLAVCSTENHQGLFPESQDGFDWKLDGLLALYDPPKENVHMVFGKLYHAGIEVKMVTGDYRETAINIATQTGLKMGDNSISGSHIMEMSDIELQKKATEVTVFYRMFPEAKLRLVEALKTNGLVIAMMGDGVNDAPALRSAQIGIAMGNKGTEMAKEAADLIFTDDNLDKINDAILQGRKIYNNLKKAIRYIISIHIPIIFTASLPLLLGWRYPNIFTPIHVIFLELIMGPTCSIFYEREPADSNLMSMKPRPPGQNMFSARELLISIVQGLVITIGLLAQYYYYMANNHPIEEVRTVVFTTLILSNIFLTFTNRSFSEPFSRTIHYKNSLVPYLLAISIIFLLCILLIPSVRNLFQLAQIDFMQFLVCFAVSLMSAGWFELFKAWKKPNRQFTGTVNSRSGIKAANL
jgi:P-type Ca2+ transporter type 2C